MRPFLLVLLCAGCGDDPTFCSGFVGDRQQAPEIELIVLGPDGNAIPIADGARVPLVQAPQGGKHIFAGFRARNIDTCPIQIIGALRDTSTEQVRFEGRPVNFLDGGDGWAYPGERDQISSYANIPVCPNTWSTKDIHEQTYALDLSASDRSGRTVRASILVTPYCSQPSLEENCRCSCTQGYVMERPCAGPG